MTFINPLAINATFLLVDLCSIFLYWKEIQNIQIHLIFFILMCVYLDPTIKEFKY